MIVINLRVLEDFIRKHADAAGPIDYWLETTERASWQHLVDVRRTFPSADGVKVTSGILIVTFTVFNIKGNRYRLITEIDYELQAVSIKAILTHAEYDKNKWKNI